MVCEGAVKGGGTEGRVVNGHWGWGSGSVKIFVKFV